MANYYVNDNAQPNGDHEVHVDTCYWYALMSSKTYLGVYSSCADAVRAAKRIYQRSNGCVHCSEECHTS